MQSHLDRHYELKRTVEVPEIAPLPTIRSERAATVAKWFGIEDQLPDSPVNPTISDRALLRSLLPKPGRIVFLTGPSGAGKSSMLRALRSLRSGTRWLDLNEIKPANVPLVDCFAGAALDQTLALLSHVGLAEAWSYLRTPEELSEGQRWRLRLALALHQSAQKAPDSHRPILMCDEFAALLDRITAAVVARCLRRSIGIAPAMGAIVATSHQDLTRALAPETIVHCDFRQIEVWELKPAHRGQ